MSPRAKKAAAPEDGAEERNAVAAATPVEETAPAEAPKRRGRPRKVATAPEAVDEASGERPAPDGAASARKKDEGAEDVATKAAKPKRTTRRKKADVAPEGEEPSRVAESDEDAQAPSEPERARTENDDAEDDVERTGRHDDERDDQPDSGDAQGDGDSNGEESRGSNNRRRGRRSRGGNTGAVRVNFRDLQSKILPELHLMAKEAGLEEYRSMEKDELVHAILERTSHAEGLRLVQGYLEISSAGYGFLQASLLHNETRKVIVSAGLIKQFKLRTGDWILGKSRPPRNNERYGTLIRVEAVNGVDPFVAAKRPRFDDLTPTFPERRIALETTANELSARVIDLLAPIGRGQRGLIVAPPKAGKTTLLKAIAHSVVTNEPDVTLIVLLVDERPEEVTDFRESVQGVEVVASTFDEPPTNHIRVAEFVHERARRIVEDGGHVMILLDSITRLARANNLVTPPTGRTLSGGLDSSALHWPKRFLGAARNIRGGGSLSILATALVETGSRMDDVIFEEFKGTGNMELHLSRRLEERRIFPAIDILKSGTRREDLLLDEATLAKMWLLRKVISDMDPAEAMEMLLSRLSRTKTNAEFLSTLGQG